VSDLHLTHLLEIVDFVGSFTKAVLYDADFPNFSLYSEYLVEQD
jgi:hypothetical protein